MNTKLAFILSASAALTSGPVLPANPPGADRATLTAAPATAILGPSGYLKRVHILDRLRREGALTDAEYRKAREKLLADSVFGTQALDQQPRLMAGVPLPRFRSVGGYEHASVSLSFVIGKDGRVRDLRILGADNPEFAMLVVQAVSRWEFRPGQKEGRAVSTAVRNFRYSVDSVPGPIGLGP